ncbi:MAG: VWA domain-containing protein [Planctomycetes bacterium]|nr:VWA domain-containing protein [Planctomycetota bacterium]
MMARLLPVAEELTKAQFTFRDAPPLWVVALLIVPAVAIVVAAVYGLEKGAPRRDVIRLAILRMLALACLIAIFFRPALERIRYRTQKSIVPILLDNSASMRRADAYRDDAERRALSKAADLAEADSPSNHTRADLVSRVVGKHIVPQLTDLGFDVQLFQFADDLSSLSSLSALSGTGDRTRLGEAIARSVEDHRGLNVPGILVFSDGRSNDGRDPRDAARLAAQDLVPVYTIGVGDPTAPSNLAIEIVEAPEVALQNDEVVITARVTGTGVDGERVLVILTSEEADGTESETLATAESSIGPGGTSGRVTLRFSPRQIGELRVAVKVQPRPDEALTDDNIERRTIRVKPEKIRVLFIEGYPRWEYRYLKNALLRADENILLHCYLTAADRDFPQECTKGLTPLKRIPTDRRSLLENYDVILFGDVPPDRLGEGREDREEFLKSVKEFVQRGGGFLMIAGEIDSPRSYAGTPIQELLPVELPGPEDEAAAVLDRVNEFEPRLETPTQPHDIVRLEDDVEQNRRLWEAKNNLRGQLWFAPVKKAKPGAEVLLRHPDARNRYGNMILAAVTFVPEGRSMFLGFDSTWRWRFQYGDRYFEKFWRRAIRYLALNRLKSGDRRFTLAVERNIFELKDRAVLEARVLDESFQPATKARQEAFVRTLRTGNTVPVSLEPVGGEPGTFRAAFQVAEEGRYQAFLTEDGSESGKRVASVEFEARLPDRENRDPMLDAATLRAVAAIATGGTGAVENSIQTPNYFPLSRASDVVKRFRGGGQVEIPEASEVRDLWDRWEVIALLVLILALEWWLRKRSQLL